MRKRIGMPPLIWREKVTICPRCLGLVKPNDSICPTCGSEFDAPINRTVMRRRHATKREELWLATIASTSILSAFFLIIAAFLSDFHRFIPPIHENALMYSAVLIAIITASLYLLSRNRKMVREGREIDKAAKILPSAMILVCSISLVLIAFSKEIDQILTEGQYFILIVMLSLFTLLLVWYLWSIDRSSQDEHKG